jgi:hypothetical protein
MLMRDEFGVRYSDEQFADLFPVRGQPAEAPWRLALVTILQFAEGLADLPKVSRIAKPPMQSADALTGNTP